MTEHSNPALPELVNEVREWLAAGNRIEDFAWPDDAFSFDVIDRPPQSPSSDPIPF